MLFISISAFFMPVYHFCTCFSKDELWNDLLPHSHKKKKKKKIHPHYCCVTPARLAKFSKMTSFFQLEECNCLCQWSVHFYMYAHAWMCNHPSFFFLFSDCRQVSRGRDNNRWSRNLFKQFTDRYSLLTPRPLCFWINATSDVQTLQSADVCLEFIRRWIFFKKVLHQTKINILCNNVELQYNMNLDS